MKYLFVAIVGFVLGAGAAGPCSITTRWLRSPRRSPNATDRVLRYSLPDHVLEFAVGEDARLFGQDTGDDSLWEETIDRTAVLGLVLNDGAESARRDREPAHRRRRPTPTCCCAACCSATTGSSRFPARARCSCAPTRTPGRS